MPSQATAQIPQVQIRHIDRLVFNARNPRKNDAAVDRMCSSIREFGFKILVLARTDGEVVDLSELERSAEASKPGHTRRSR